MGDVHSTAAPTRVAAIRLIFFITFSSLLGPSWGALAGSQFRPYNNWLSFGQFLAIRPLAIVVALIVGGVCSAQAAHKDAKHCAVITESFAISGDWKLRVLKTACANTATR
jgi:hypothetical protein